MAKEIEKAVIDELIALKAELEALKAARPSQTPGDVALQLLAERSAPKENPNFNEKGPFQHKEGGRVRPKGKLSRPTHFAGARQHEDNLTPEEIDAFNAITQTRTARNGTWTAEVRQNGSAQELYVDVPVKTMDDRMSLPSLLMILYELQNGSVAADPSALVARVAELEKRLAVA